MAGHDGGRAAEHGGHALTHRRRDIMAEQTLGLGPCAEYKHDHPPVRNVIAEHEDRLALGQRVADRVALVVGSWPFILAQSAILGVWIAINLYLVLSEMRHPGLLKAWDPYPFILLNLVLSFQAAYTGPVVMMSQNRQTEKDRLMAQHDYEINQKAEEELEVVMDHLEHQDRLILDAIARLESLQVTPPVREVAHKLEEVLKRVERNDQRVEALLARLERGS
jgi:uncharacterized membrane protein